LRVPQSFDPFRLLGRAVDGARLGLDIANWTQQQVTGAIRRGLDELDPVDAVSVGDEVAVEETAEPSGPSRESLNDKMSQLLSRALDQNTSGGQVELYHHLLDQLVADEARIIGALSDGSSSPLVNVYGWSRSRTQGKAVLENASLIGRTANVALPRMTPTYVAHLAALGLVQTGPEDPGRKTDYEVLMAETMVLDAIKDGSRGPMPAKVEKLTVSLSELGCALWAAAIAEGDGR
jgi:Abortive infection alpha